MDAAYFNAIEIGDFSKAAEIVDASAKAAGYSGPFWHGGTVRGEFEENPEAKAHYVSVEMEHAASYAEQYRPDEAEIRPSPGTSRSLQEQSNRVRVLS